MDKKRLTLWPGDEEERLGRINHDRRSRQILTRIVDYCCGNSRLSIDDRSEANPALQKCHPKVTLHTVIAHSESLMSGRGRKKSWNGIKLWSHI
jgi:hypothetical protein